MQLQDCQNLTPKKIVSYNDLLVVHLEKDIIDGLVKGFLTPLKLVRHGGCPVGFKPMDPPFVYDEKNGQYIDKRFAFQMVFSYSEVEEWEKSWIRIPDNGDFHQHILEEKIRWKRIAHEFMDRYNRAFEEVEKLKSKLSTYRAQVEERLVAYVCPDERQTQNTDADQTMALPEPKNQQDPVFPSGSLLLETVCDLRARGASPEEIVGELCDGPFHVSAAAARYFAVSDDVLLDDVEKSTEKGVLNKSELNNKRSTNGSDLYKRYKKSLESKECASTRDADRVSCDA